MRRKKSSCVGHHLPHMILELKLKRLSLAGGQSLQVNNRSDPMS
jgi:hypothetical protein